MRRRLDSAVIRRDDRLARTRALSAWVASGTTAACIALAGVLGIAIPGHSAPTGHPPSHSGHRTAPSHNGHRSAPSHGGHRIAPPAAPPSGSTAPPVVSSGGS